MTRVDDVLETLARRLTRAELEELALKVADVEVEPIGEWQLWHGNKLQAIGSEMVDVKIQHRLEAKHDDEPGVNLSLTFWHGQNDGVPVVQIDGTGRFRVNVNDAPIWDADPEQHEHKFCKCVKASEQ